MRPELLEKLKQAGINVEGIPQTPVAPQVQATGGIERLSPGASQLLESVRQMQAASPVHIPFAAGTPTQRRREADTSAEQWQTGHGFDREMFDWEKDLKERQFAADEGYRQQQLALSKMRASAGGGSAGGTGGAGGLGGYAPRTATLTERDRIPYSAAGVRMIEDIRNNPDINLGQWKATIQGDSQIRGALMEQGIDINDFLSFIDEQYTLYHLQEAMGRVGQPVTPWDYGQDLQKRQDLIKQYNPWGVPTKEKDKKAKEEEEIDFFGT